jgi:predicted Zn-dependent protease
MSGLVIMHHWSLIIENHPSIYKEAINMKRRYLSQAVMVVCLSIQPFAWTQAHADGSSLTAFPKSINQIYADIDMRLTLATKKNATPCEAAECVSNHEFDERVQSIGQKLAVAAFDLYPNLEQRIPYFQFSVADKDAVGTASNASGDIVLFRGVQNLGLNDDALSFVIAREMGHVIGQHHSKNSSTKMIISALASFVFPIAGIIGASSTAAQASTASTLVTSAASTATSYIGSKVAMISVKPSQLAESDTIAKSLLESQNGNLHLVLSGLPNPDTGTSDWLKDLQTSKTNLSQQLKTQATTVALVVPKL